MIGLILSIYVLGVFASLWVMHTFKNELDINHYDLPHDDYYDDYDSNAEAYVAFSLMWPLYWFMQFFIYLWKGLIWISTQFEKK